MNKMNPVIPFSHNWNNKLDNDVFMTVRRWTPEKFDFYSRIKGQEVDIVLNNKLYCQPIFKGILAVMTFKDIQPSTLMLDTGMTELTKICKLFENFRVKADTKTMILLFEKQKINRADYGSLDKDYLKTDGIEVVA